MFQVLRGGGERRADFFCFFAFFSLRRRLDVLVYDNDNVQTIL